MTIVHRCPQCINLFYPTPASTLRCDALYCGLSDDDIREAKDETCGFFPKGPDD